MINSVASGGMMSDFPWLLGFTPFIHLTIYTIIQPVICTEPSQPYELPQSPGQKFIARSPEVARACSATFYIL